MNFLSYKGVYRIEYNFDGFIEHRKVRLVIRCFSQLVALDYNETFSPIVKPTTIRIILALAITYGLASYVHLDFLTMFATLTDLAMVVQQLSSFLSL